VIRDGYVVTWQGREFDAVPDGDDVRIYTTQPADGFEEVKPGRYVRVLTPEEYDELVYVRTTCTWRGAPFLVLGEADNWFARKTCSTLCRRSAITAFWRARSSTDYAMRATNSFAVRPIGSRRMPGPRIRQTLLN